MCVCVLQTLWTDASAIGLHVDAKVPDTVKMAVCSLGHLVLPVFLLAEITFVMCVLWNLMAHLGILINITVVWHEV